MSAERHRARSVLARLGRTGRRLSPAARLLETRLGPGATERADLHERLDVLERYLAHLAGQGDRNTRETAMTGERIVEVDWAIRDELREELNRVRREVLERISLLEDRVAPPSPDPSDLAFVAASLGPLLPRSVVLVLDDAALAAALVPLHLEVAMVTGPGVIADGCRPVDIAAAAAGRWDAIVDLGSPCVALDWASLVRPGGRLVVRAAEPVDGFTPVRSSLGRDCLLRDEN